jgi:3-hydroxyisobutyrate dehydrogenase-like beta-hydroxyacid dehydrogenase
MSGPIGFIGLGIMGKGMARNLITKIPGDYVVWNRSAAASEELAAAFPGKVTIAATAAEVVAKCNLTYSMLSTMEASEAVFDGDAGLISGICAGKTVVDCATLTPERMMKISDEIKGRGGCFLEAPVSGSKIPAEVCVRGACMCQMCLMLMFLCMPWVFIRTPF